MKDWFAFFSHTGTEIVNICESAGIIPKRIITNKTPGDSTINKKLLDLPTEIIWFNNRPDLYDYNRVLSRCDECICTLHGWMRLIPEEICDEYDVYNLHPGLITQYPELKGADPQKRITEDHKNIGLVIHKVTAELDAGPVIMEHFTQNTTNDVDTNIQTLHKMATEAWLDFFDKHI